MRRSWLGPVWPLLGIYQALKSLRKISYHAGGPRGPPRIETLRGAAQGSYLETLPQLFSKSSTFPQILPPIRPKSIPKLAQILPRSTQILPKSSQILRKIDPKFPFYLISGDEDPVGGKGNKVKDLFCKLSETGIEDIKMTLYSGSRHEVFNETNRREVCFDIQRWMDKILNR